MIAKLVSTISVLAGQTWTTITQVWVYFKKQSK
jgi:hypothetical protein